MWEVLCNKILVCGKIIQQTPAILVENNFFLCHYKERKYTSLQKIALFNNLEIFEWVYESKKSNKYNRKNLIHHHKITKEWDQIINHKVMAEVLGSQYTVYVKMKSPWSEKHTCPKERSIKTSISLSCKRKKIKPAINKANEILTTEVKHWET